MRVGLILRHENQITFAQKRPIRSNRRRVLLPNGAVQMKFLAPLIDLVHLLNQLRLEHNEDMLKLFIFT
jgi:hypothetical protein